MTAWGAGTTPGGPPASHRAQGAAAAAPAARRRRLGRLAALALVALALGACGKKGPPVAPELRLPQAVSGLHGAVSNGAIELTWLNPTRRADGTRLRELTVAEVWRTEDAGDGPAKPALWTRGRINGYTQVMTIPLAVPPVPSPAPPDAPAIDGTRVRVTDRAGLVQGRRYTYAVVVRDAQTRPSPPGPRLSLVLLAAPEPPRELRAEGLEDEVRLAWQPPERLVDGTAPPGPLGYEILRAPAVPTPPGMVAPVPAPPLEVITPHPVAEPRYVDRDVDNDQPYLYAVRAVRRARETTAVSRATPAVEATPVDLTPPSTPTAVVAIPAPGAVHLSWRASPEPDVAVYNIARAPEVGEFTRVGFAHAPATTFVDRDIPPGVYRYVVTAQDASLRANESRPSPEVTVTVP
jgi:hypothetical protein